jgi:hypothetical protein
LPALIVIKRLPHVNGKNNQISFPNAVRPIIAVNSEVANPMKRVVIKPQIILKKKYMINDVIKAIHVKANPYIK